MAPDSVSRFIPISNELSVSLILFYSLQSNFIYADCLPLEKVNDSNGNIFFSFFFIASKYSLWGYYQDMKSRQTTTEKENSRPISLMKADARIPKTGQAK